MTSDVIITYFLLIKVYLVLFLKWAIPLLAAIIFHEVAHAWAAKKLGDETADKLGRITLNPIKHIHPIGSIALPALLYLLKAPFIFGYARPVPINYRNLHTLPRDIALVAAAGPAANIVLIIISALLFNVGSLLPVPWQKTYAEMLVISVGINTILAAFNRLPIPPLDGSKILMVYAPNRLAVVLARLQTYGLFLVLGILLLLPWISELIGFNPLSVFFQTLMNVVFTAIEPLMQLHCLWTQSEACGNLPSTRP